MTPSLTRREMLTAASLGSAGAVLGSSALASASESQLFDALVTAAPANPGSDIGAIKHIVMVMMENRSFDHMYGTLRGVRGFDDDSTQARRAFKQKLPNGEGFVYPYRFNTDTMDASCTVGPEHDWAPMQRQYRNGRINFVRSQINAQPTNPDVTGPMTMGYYNRKDLRYYYRLADRFTICDNYFCSVLGPTNPNRAYAMSGSIGADGRHGGPCIETTADNWQKFSWTTVPELLDDAGVSWKVYAPTQSPDGFSGGPISLIAGNNILGAFKQYADPSTRLHKRAFTNDWPGQFLTDVANNKLPRVSWVWPGAVPGFDEHPSAPVVRGSYGTDLLLQALFKNKELWSKTLVVHTYDEHGGYFDHVPPPQPDPGTPGEFLSVSPLPPETEGFAGPIGMGFRVPTMLLSPWTRGGFVSNQLMDHASPLFFLEERFGIKVRAISKWRRKTSNNLAVALQMDNKRMSIPKLPPAPMTPRKVREQCTEENLNAELGGSEIPYPKKQRMPSQEAGTRKVVRNGKKVGTAVLPGRG